MNTQFWLGMLTFPATALAVALVWMTLAFAGKIWQKLHQRLLITVTPAETAPLRTRQANTIGDALQKGNSVHMVSGLGWVLVWARDSKTAPVVALDDAESEHA